MHGQSAISMLIFAAPLFSTEITEVGDRAYRVVLAGSNREASIPNPDSLDVFITSAKGKVCWDADRHPDTGCVGPGGSNVSPTDGFIDPNRPAGALLSRTADGRTRLVVNDRDTDAAFTANTGQFEFDVFLAPRETVESGGREWIRNNLVRLETAEPGLGIADLEAVRKIVGNARIVSLGEAAHGTREFFQLKHRMLELMASEGGSIVFAIEGNMPEAQRLNDYVLNGTGDPVALMRQNLFGIWNTEEVLELVRWIREHNSSGRGKIQFTGFDMQQPTLPAQIAKQFATRADPELVPDLDRFHGEALKRVNDLFTYYSNPGAAPRGLATSTLPVSAAPEGRRIRFSGYIKTEDVYRGQANLWWQMVAGGRPVINDTMAGRGAAGNSGWTRYEMEVTIPAGVTSIAFGAMHTGDGTAWFDNFAVEVDGVPFSDERLDFDFEAENLRGFSTSGTSFAASLDNTTAQRGRQSLRLRLDGFLPYSEAVSGCAAIVERMEANRESFSSKGIAAAEAEWGIQNARLVWQFVSFLPSLVELRDKFMADNVAWIAAQNPDSRIVLWAHNAHVAIQGAPYTNTVGLTSSVPMGAHLRSKFGADMVVFGFGFHQGSFRAVDLAGGGAREFRMTPAPAGSLDAILGEMGVPLFALDFREAPRTGPGALVRQTLAALQIGSVYDTRIPTEFFSAIDSAGAYDVLLFVESTTAARPVR